MGAEPRTTRNWSGSETWSALEFRSDVPHHYQYQYDSTNDVVYPSRSTFSASAFGDFDGDGVRSTFVRFGTLEIAGFDHDRQLPRYRVNYPGERFFNDPQE